MTDQEQARAAQAAADRAAAEALDREVAELKPQLRAARAQDGMPAQHAALEQVRRAFVEHWQTQTNAETGKLITRDEAGLMLRPVWTRAMQELDAE